MHLNYCLITALGASLAVGNPFPNAQSDTVAVSIEDVAPKCNDEGAGDEIVREEVQDSIKKFCSNQDYWPQQIVPHIEVGTGKYSNGRTKTWGIFEKFDLGDKPDKLWLKEEFTKSKCTQRFNFAQGTNGIDKGGVQHCTARFMRVVDGCEQKRGGTFRDGCAEYTLAAGGDDLNFGTQELGDFVCEDSSKVYFGKEEDRTCTCRWSEAPANTAFFKKPKDGTCDDVKREDVIEPFGAAGST